MVKSEPVKDYLGIQRIPGEFYEADLELLDRYQAFSAEIVRVALLGLAVLGFFLDKLRQLAPASSPSGTLIRDLLAIGAVLLAGAAAAGLLHRFYSSDGIYFHLRAVRGYLLANQQQTDQVRRDGYRCGRRYRLSDRWLQIAEYLVAAGGLLVGVALGVLLVFAS